MNGSLADISAAMVRTMKCPNCGHEQPKGEAECRRCQVIFDKFLERMARRAQPPAAEAAALDSGPASAAPDFSPEDSQALKRAAAAGFVVGLFTLFAVGLELSGAAQLGLGPWALVDVSLFFGLSYGVARGSRVCACGLLLLYAGGKLLQWAHQPPAALSLAVPLLIAGALARGALASFSRRG